MDEAQVGGVGRPEGGGADPTRGGVDEGRVGGGQPRGEHLVRSRVRARVRVRVSLPGFDPSADLC